MMYNKTSADRTTGHCTVANFITMVEEHNSLNSLLVKYGHQKYFWTKLDIIMCKKGLEVDHYTGSFKPCLFPSHMERSKRTGKLIRVFD